MACVFCGIIEGTIPAAMVTRDDDVVAFLDMHPLFKGHVLVVPRAHTDTLHTLSPTALPPLFAAVQGISRAVIAACDADGSFVALNNVVSQSVPHLHVHVVPRKKGDGLRGFFWPRQRYASDEERAQYAEKIAAALRAGA